MYITTGLSSESEDAIVEFLLNVTGSAAPSPSPDVIEDVGHCQDFISECWSATPAASREESLAFYEELHQWTGAMAAALREGR